MSKKTEILDKENMQQYHIRISVKKLLLQKKLMAKLEKLKIRSEIINEEWTLITYILYKQI